MSWRVVEEENKSVKCIIIDNDKMLIENARQIYKKKDREFQLLIDAIKMHINSIIFI